METKTVIIPCPSCHAPVMLEINQLISGIKFSCTQCTALIGLSSDSKETVKQVVDHFESTKNQLK